MKIDKGTLIRTIVLLIALINQSLIMLGFPVIEIGEAEVTSLVEGIYLVASLILSLVSIIVAWWKNNYVSKKGQAQKEVLQKEGLTNAK